MKFIISHDIDHFYWSDHFFKDLFIPKYLTKNFYYLLRGKISIKVFCSRMSLFSSNRFGRLEDLTEFNLKNNVPATYFMGVDNALNLSYSIKTAQRISKYLNGVGLPLHLHGISFNNEKDMGAEKEKFVNVVGHFDGIGVRMHYLRNSPDTLSILSSLNYSFDSTLYELKDPYLIGNMVEFPVSLMEVYLITYFDDNLDKIIEATIKKIKEAETKKIKYFTIIFHDHHYSSGFELHKLWYEWLIGFIKSENYEMINFSKACEEFRSLKS